MDQEIPFECDLCEKSFPTEEKIRKHYTNQHRHVTKECPKCLMVLNVRLSQYKNHMKKCFKNLFFCHICMNKNVKRKTEFFRSLKRFKEHYFEIHSEKEQIFNISNIHQLTEISGEEVEKINNENIQAKSTISDNDSETRKHKDLLNESHDDIEELEEGCCFHKSDFKKCLVKNKNLEAKNQNLKVKNKNLGIENEFLKREKKSIKKKLSGALSKLKKLENEIESQARKRSASSVTIFDRINGHI